MRRTQLTYVEKKSLISLPVCYLIAGNSMIKRFSGVPSRRIGKEEEIVREECNSIYDCE